MTFGHLAGELVRRVSGKELMEYLHDNILDPLDVADFFIGLPDSVTDTNGKLVPFDQSRVADLVDGDGATDVGTPGSFNRPEVRRAVIPSANGAPPQYRSRLGCILLKTTANIVVGRPHQRPRARADLLRGRQPAEQHDLPPTHRPDAVDALPAAFG